MQLHRVRVELPSTQRPLALHGFGDIHLGAAACDVNDALRTRDLIANDPHARWIGMGDYADAIMPTDPRWAMRSLDFKRLGRGDDGAPDVGDLAAEQVELVDHFFEPIWDKCLGLLEGNHEQALERWYFTNLTKRLAHRHDVPWLGQTALIRIELAYPAQKYMYPIDVFAEHGASGGGTDGNAINSLAKRLDQFKADIYLKGHVHKRGVLSRTELAWGPSKPQIRRRVLVLTGAYLRGYVFGDTTYAERKGLPPNEIGGVVVLIRPRRSGSSSFATRIDIDAVYTEAFGLMQ